MFLAVALATVLTAEDASVEADVDAEVENERLQRIGYSVLGGGLGLAAPLLGGVALQTLEGPCMFMFGCSTGGPMAAMVGLLPGTFGIGLGVAHHARGGKAGIGFGLAGGLAGYMSAVATLGIISASSNSEWAKTYPGAGAGLITALSLLCSVGAMELRHSELEAGAKEWRLGRGLAAGAIFWLAAVPTQAALTALAFATGGGIYAVLPIGTAVTLLASGVAAWGVHRGMDGRAKFWPVMVGALAGASLGGAFLALHAYAPPAGGLFSGFTFNYTSIPLMAFGCLIAVAGPSIALEWSNALNSAPGLEPYEKKSSTVDWQVQGGFGPGGGTIGLSGRF